MLYIIFVIHGICNFAFLPLLSKTFSLLMIEMPIMFWISGVSMKLSSNKTLGAFVVSKIKRIILPYVIWCAFALLTIILYGDLSRDFYNIILCRELNTIPYVNQMWFIVPYFIISIMGFFLIKLYKRYGSKFVCIYLFTFSMAIVIMDLIGICKSSHNIIRIIMAYSCFYIVGFTYKNADNLVKTIGVLATLLYILLLSFGFYQYPTQINKFPPNFIYVCFGFIPISTIVMLISHIMIPNLRIFSFANKYGIELYLYQNFAFWIYAVFIFPPIDQAPTIFKYIIEIIFVPICLFPLAFAVNKLNVSISRIIKF